MGETSLLGITFTQLNDVSIVAVVQVPSHPSSYTCTFCLACGVWTSHTHTYSCLLFFFLSLSTSLLASPCCSLKVGGHRAPM